MAEWIYEAGIGECRAALITDGRIVEAMTERDSDGPRADAVVDARLVNKTEFLAKTAQGIEVYVPRWPNEPEGTTVRLAMRRMAIPERGVIKRAIAMPVDAQVPLSMGADLAERIAATGLPVRSTGFGEDTLGDAGWNELIDEAQSGIAPFSGGLLRICLTPAMTVVDVDGTMAGPTLANHAVTALAAAIRRYGIGGNIVIDLPSLTDAAARKAVAVTFDHAMAASATPFERTAVNGFGLLQIIVPRLRASLLERVQLAPVETAALSLLRRAERAIGTGALSITAHPAVTSWLHERPNLIAELARRTGRPIILHADPARAMGAGHAQ